jgi:hypothetical protein
MLKHIVQISISKVLIKDFDKSPITILIVKDRCMLRNISIINNLIYRINQSANKDGWYTLRIASWLNLSSLRWLSDKALYKHAFVTYEKIPLCIF